MTAKPNDFDGATFYECLDRDSELSHATVAEAIEAAIDNAWESEGDTPDILIAKIAPVVVTAHARRPVTDERIKTLTYVASDEFEAAADLEFGNSEEFNKLWTDAESIAIRAEMAAVIRRAMDCASIWRCDVVGKRSYTAVEIAAILTGETA